MQEISQKTTIASRHEEAAKTKKKELDIKSVQIDKDKKEADEKYANAIPLLAKANEALSKID